MPPLTTKAEVAKLIDALPEDSSLDEIIERLILLRKIEVGLAEAGHGIPQSAVEAEFMKPPSERSWHDS
ncbi:MAG: hypothetical protein AAF752_12465 [Bacteroidota bacterium]